MGATRAIDTWERGVWGTFGDGAGSKKCTTLLVVAVATVTSWKEIFRWMGNTWCKQPTALFSMHLQWMVFDKDVSFVTIFLQSLKRVCFLSATPVMAAFI